MVEGPTASWEVYEQGIEFARRSAQAVHGASGRRGSGDPPFGLRLALR